MTEQIVSLSGPSKAGKSVAIEKWNMDCYKIGSLICEFDASERDEVLSSLIQCIARLPEIQKKVLAMYYYENLELSEIAIGIGLTEYETDQLRARALGVLQATLANQLGQQLSWAISARVTEIPHRPLSTASF